MIARPLEAVIDRAGVLPRDVDRGLDLLSRSWPLWPVPIDEWQAVVGRVRIFAERWDSRACAAGWPALQLYGFHPLAPLARLDCMGAGWLVARRGHRVVDVAPTAITLGVSTGYQLRIYRIANSGEARLAWDFIPTR